MKEEIKKDEEDGEMDFIDVLKEKDIRLVYNNRWLVFDNFSQRWVVYECKYYGKKTIKLVETRDHEVATEVLIEEG